MNPYLVFSGTASVGKTTIVKELLPWLESKYGEVKYISEVARSIQAKGYKINKEATCETQRLIEDEYCRLEELYKDNIRVADRSIIDRFSYAMLNDGEHISPEKGELLRWYGSNIRATCRKYSHIFFIPLSESLKLDLDGIRSSDEQYRQDIDRIQRRIIESFEIPFHILEGSTEERLEKIKNIMIKEEQGCSFHMKSPQSI